MDDGVPACAAFSGHLLHNFGEPALHIGGFAGIGIKVIKRGRATGKRVVFESRAAQGEMVIFNFAQRDIRDAGLR